MKEHGISRGLVVTRTQEERVDPDAGRVDVIPAWRFLLELPEP